MIEPEFAASGSALQSLFNTSRSMQMDSPSTWVTLIIALTSSFFGGAVGVVFAVWFRSRHERAEAWRERLIDSADAFCDSLAEALDVAYTVIYIITEDIPTERIFDNQGDLTEEALEPLRRVRRASNEVRRRLVRVELLFGLRSSVSAAARSAATNLDLIEKQALRKRPLADAERSLDLARSRV